MEQDAGIVVRETNPGSFVELGKQITKTIINDKWSVM